MTGELCDKFADSTVQLGVRTKAREFRPRERKACPRAKPFPLHDAGVTTKEDLGGHVIANKATNDTHRLFYELPASRAKTEVLRCDAKSP
jgi:hypothetical protein